MSLIRDNEEWKQRSHLGKLLKRKADEPGKEEDQDQDQDQDEKEKEKEKEKEQDPEVNDASSSHFFIFHF